MQLRRRLHWGDCWVACRLYEQLERDQFWRTRLLDSRTGINLRHILQTLVCYRLIDPGSEWRLHRLWFEQSAMADLLGADYALAEMNALYRCLDKLLATRLRCSRTCASAGKTCSRPALKCCCTT